MTLGETALELRGGRSAVTRVIVIGLLLSAFALRFGYLLEFKKSPFFEALPIDEGTYDRWAQEIAGGEWLGHGTFTANPLSPYMLGIIYTIFGRDLFHARLIQMIADTASCYFIYRITLSLFDRRAALFAMALAAAYGPTIFCAANFVAEVWVVFFASLSLALLVSPDRWTPGERPSGPPSRSELRGEPDRDGPVGLRASGLRFSLAGLCFAIAALGRPNLMLMAPILPLAIGLGGSRPPNARYSAFKRGIYWMAGVALVLGASFMRNAVRGDDAVLISAHSGVNLWIGNNPDANGFFNIPANSGLKDGQTSLIKSSIKVAERNVGHPLKASESSSWWTRQALAWILTNPSSFLALTLKKAGYFFNEYERPLESNYHFGKLQSNVLSWLTLGFGLACPLALTGIVLAWPRRRKLAALYLFATLYAAGVIAFFVSMRYRMPIVIVFFPFAGFAMGAFADSVRPVTPKLLAPALATLALMVALTKLPLAVGEVPHDLAYTHNLLGKLDLYEGREEDAIKQFEKAIALYPEWGFFHGDLGLAHLKNKDPERATAALEKAIELHGASVQVYRNLARAFRAQGKLDEAARAYRRALSLVPEDEPTLRAQIEAHLRELEGAAPADTSEIAPAAEDE